VSKNINVNPGNYKVAGRERQGEDIVHEAEKQTYARHQKPLEGKAGKNRPPRAMGAGRAEKRPHQKG
jgi:hypothetical protein